MRGDISGDVTGDQTAIRPVDDASAVMAINGATHDHTPRRPSFIHRQRPEPTGIGRISPALEDSQSACCTWRQRIQSVPRLNGSAPDSAKPGPSPPTLQLLSPLRREHIPRRPRRPPNA